MDDRFWSKIEPTGFCWLWTSAIDRGGYPIYWVGDGVSRRAHRLAYEELVGPIPDGLSLDHLCRVRHCVNPDHLEPCSAGANAARSPLAPYNVRARQTHCRRGHEYTVANTAIHNGRRECRACAALMAREETEVTDDNTLLGVVQPDGGDIEDAEWLERQQQDDQPPAINGPFFAHAASVVANSLQATRTRLAELRAHRDGPLAEEIRQLVSDEDLLERMHRVTLRRNGEVAE